MTTSTDLTIIGAGPSGLFAAFYAGMRGLSVQIVDSLPHIGGQPQALYPHKKIFDIGGLPQIKASLLIQQLQDQLTPFQASTQFFLNETVANFYQENESFVLQTSHQTLYSKSILIATGAGSFQARKLALKEASTFENKGLFYTLTNPQNFADQTVAVLGGGDSAFDYCLSLAPYCKKIFLIHRRSQFRGHEHSLSRLQSFSNIEILTPYQVVALKGNEHDQLSALVLKEARGEASYSLPVHSVLPAFGFTGSTDLLKTWPITLDKHRISVNHWMATSHPGVYAIGDIVSYPGKVQLIASGFGEAPTAINAISNYLHPKAKLSPIHSTTYFSQK
ncbi:NAD(P)/FAD-dependent oxidoreductase [Aerococcus christensenii]|uniref:NAD(P)/FAD-dependent oxidoreductase n=1 Tax=Aerococcus christensenii TaxID=87541 RepID=UPI0007631EE8|nr:NAD(P)/FAD-dependent oxidoreductase [Aerococcus christensenii]AMB92032.1 hypothetical protein AWM71_01265 [Aerococcus christensenii]